MSDHTDHERSQWADLLSLYDSNYDKAAAVWRKTHNNQAPPCAHGQQEVIAEQQNEQGLMWDIQKALEALGWRVTHLDAGSKQQTAKARAGRPPAGWPDLLCMAPGGRVVWLEVKTAKGRVSEMQEALHAEFEWLGQRVVVVRSVAQALEVLQ